MDEYDFSEESKLGDDKLSLYTFKGKKWAGDIGFSTQLELNEVPYGCYQCQVPSGTRQLYIDGVAFIPATEEPPNFI